MKPPLAHITLRSVAVGGAMKPELLSLLEAAGVKLNAMAMRLFDDARFDTAPSKAILRTCEISLNSLGFSSGATIDAIHARAAEHGLVPGPLELGPHMRLQLLDQPEGRIDNAEARHQAPNGSVTVASIPVSDDEDFPCGFYLRRIEGALWLRGYQSWSGHLWNPEDRFVFVEQAFTSLTAAARSPCT